MEKKYFKLQKTKHNKQKSGKKLNLIIKLLKK